MQQDLGQQAQVVLRRKREPKKAGMDWGLQQWCLRHPVVSKNNLHRFLALLSKCFMICTLYLHLSFFYRCGRMECSSLHESKCADDSSEESREGPIVDVNVGRPGGRRGKGMNTRRNQSMMNYTRRGSGGSAGGSGGCPGSLEDCIAACPSSVRAFKVCTANCERRCSKK